MGDGKKGGIPAMVKYSSGFQPRVTEARVTATSGKRASPKRPQGMVGSAIT